MAGPDDWGERPPPLTEPAPTWLYIAIGLFVFIALAAVLWYVHDRALIDTRPLVGGEIDAS